MTRNLYDLLAIRAARKVGLSSARDAEEIETIVQFNRTAARKIQVRADERVVVLKVRQPDGGMK